jgi:hypothetical protein
MTWLHLFGMLLIVATVLLTLIVMIVVALMLRARRPRAAAATLGALMGWYVLHLGFVAGVSAGEPERRLAPGHVKRFCGFYLDCHLGAAVVGSRRLDSIGDRYPTGVFEVVTIEISSTARGEPLGPYGLRATLIDSTGARYERDLAAERAMAGGNAAVLEEALEPGGSYRRHLVFDVPAAATGLALDVRERGLPDDVLEWMLPGDEDSFLHRRTLLALSTAS